MLDDTTTLVLLLGTGSLFAVFASRLARFTRVPAPALFLAAGVAISAWYPDASTGVSFEQISRIGTFALIAILFFGGLDGGYRRMRPVFGSVLSLGLVGTLLTSLLLGGFTYLVLGASWQLSMLVSIALSPTDPAAVFSVLGGNRLSGDSDILLEGESGANDPVGIALMIGGIEFVLGDGGVGTIVGRFALELVVGVVVGYVAGRALASMLARVRDWSSDMHGLAALAGALVIYGSVSMLHGSGFLAVFVAGLCVGDVRGGSEHGSRDILGFSAAMAEIVMFTVLGLSVRISEISGPDIALAFAIFLVLTLVIRPAVTWLSLAASGFTRVEKAFVSWGGLKGAVPILLASFPIIAGVHHASTIYHIVFIAVAASIIIQGTSLPWLARRFHLLEPY